MNHTHELTCLLLIIMSPKIINLPLGGVQFCNFFYKLAFNVCCHFNSLKPISLCFIFPQILYDEFVIPAAAIYCQVIDLNYHKILLYSITYIFFCAYLNRHNLDVVSVINSISYRNNHFVYKIGKINRNEETKTLLHDVYPATDLNNGETWAGRSDDEENKDI
jgi:hypothetical protein